MSSRPSPTQERIFRAHTFWFLREYSEPTPICPIELVMELENLDLREMGPITLNRVIKVLEALEGVGMLVHDLPEFSHLHCELPHFHPTKEFRAWADDDLLEQLGWREAVYEPV
ncbi:MAG: hypothetical protein U0165_17525 [Polyangiaceae bacterium]